MALSTIADAHHLAPQPCTSTQQEREEVDVYDEVGKHDLTLSSELLGSGAFAQVCVRC